MAFHDGVAVIRLRPIRVDRLLCFGESELSGTDETLKFHLQPILLLGAARSCPRLEHQIIETARMAAQGQGNNLIEFVFGLIGLGKPCLPQQYALHSVGIGRRGQHRLRVAGTQMVWAMRFWVTSGFRAIRSHEGEVSASSLPAASKVRIIEVLCS